MNGEKPYMSKRKALRMRFDFANELSRINIGIRRRIVQLSRMQKQALEKRWYLVCRDVRLLHTYVPLRFSRSGSEPALHRESGTIPALSRTYMRKGKIHGRQIEIIWI